MEAMKKSTVLLWIRILGALFCTYSLSWILPIGGNLIAINYSVVSVLLAVLFFLFLRRAFNGADRRSVCISVIFGTVFALMLLLGVQMNQSDSLRALKSFRFVPAFIGASLLCTAAVHALLTASARYATGYSEAKEHWFFRADKKMFFLIWAVIFICWIPCFLATYPGVFAYDGVTQIFDVAGGRLSALHPVLHSYFIAGCFAIGALFDSLRAGMAIYSILQMLFFSMTLRFIPLLTEKARTVRQAQRSIGKTGEGGMVESIRSEARVFSVMTGWVLENGIVTADSMASRGYGISRRTSYSVYRFRAVDSLRLLLLCALSAVTICGISLGWIGFRWYPSIVPPAVSTRAVASYLAYAILCILPGIFRLREVILWHRLRSVI